MADEGIKKIVFSQNLFPPVPPTGKYSIRFRVRSQSGDTVSSWTQKIDFDSIPVYELIQKLDDTYDPYQSYKVIHKDNTIDLTWDTPAGFPNDTFDVYVRWGIDGDIFTKPFEYLSTVKAKSVSASVPSSLYNYVEFYVQVETSDHSLSDYAFENYIRVTELFSTGLLFINDIPGIDGGSPAIDSLAS